ncbi:hypothetical protein M5K25_008102 [Dendrobium thyrsiflorum]|uniref:Uncharacterized protein n=1 Tax=Dendrobium thyrsiflorum TaxID=117978 RepID=A0ABD0V7T2_DENTH
MSNQFLRTSVTGNEELSFGAEVLIEQQKKKGMFQHSSFLAGGSTVVAGRFTAEDGFLRKSKHIVVELGHLTFLQTPGKSNLKEVPGLIRSLEALSCREFSDQGSADTTLPISSPSIYSGRVEPKGKSDAKRPGCNRNGIFGAHRDI